ncbi:MAG: formate/nitrite transporter family protein [Spirochaetales bacterium]|nr:formate/nitrite transporter family protein [Spirochaetales bacterium]MCF7938450.1 formate/nitrite transporter family protein [Spirochaetales bacterium]
MSNTLIKSPKDVIFGWKSLSITKSEIPALRLLALAVLAGTYIGFAAHLATTVSVGWAEAGFPAGLENFFVGSVFSVGLMLVIIPGSELFTGNTLMTIGWFSGSIGARGMLRNWVLVYIGNFAGSIFLAFLLAGATGLLDGAVGGKAIAIAYGKVTAEAGVLPHWASFLARAVACNILVTLAVLMAGSATTVGGKILAVFFPIMAFVASGFEHSVANMYFLPAGIIASGFDAAAGSSGIAPAQLAKLGWGSIWTGNLIVVTIGNIIGGGFFVGGLYYLIHKTGK